MGPLLVFAPGRCRYSGEPVMSEREVINGFDVDALARALFDARSNRRPLTDEEWKRRKASKVFVTTNQMLFEQARAEAEES
jgi:hypothetical protein